ncbi:MAG: dTMP kinase [Gammaproteobacteria bacterium]|nr:dTMP kinase [Gammaproteobacteria bacterium]
MKRGRFITVEGIEGVGKSTNIGFIRRLIEQAGFDVVVTREPGGTPLAEQIRDIVLRTEHDLPSQTEMLLMFAARSANVCTQIRPALDAGSWVLCDRFTDATIAYQGYGRGVDIETIMTLAQVVHGDLWPDLTLLLDTPVETGLGRAAKRSAPDRFESEQLEFFNRVRAGYLELARSERIELVDASVSLEQVQQQIAAIIEPYLGPGQ